MDMIARQRLKPQSLGGGRRLDLRLQRAVLVERIGRYRGVLPQRHAPRLGHRIRRALAAAFAWNFPYAGTMYASVIVMSATTSLPILSTLSRMR